jgi:Lrp/AsnC family leucine-responsive transcriptional regulator
MKSLLSKEELTTPDYMPDKKDLAILKLLQENARITVKEIAEKVHLSTTPVHERIKRLEESGVITQYATLVDHAKVKKGLTVICYVSLKQHGKNAGVKFIKTMNELNAYYDFHVNKLSEIENVGHVQSVFVMGIIKQTHQVIWGE